MAAGRAERAIREVFACGTGAAVKPVGRLVRAGGEVVAPDTGAEDSVTVRPRRRLVDIRFGRVEDPHGRLRRLVRPRNARPPRTPERSGRSTGGSGTGTGAGL
ncbi:hypothetical protein [Streptomyces sp. adm13(2018)]|uniref:hypothetical protein n=1 Tax=Streptomyces sp. adm13(2018) TaxID=2479007 RepID=UPI001650506E|nr:hypothetical protein [Streptomyces sp. adm13(2018)]